MSAAEDPAAGLASSPLRRALAALPALLVLALCAAAFVGPLSDVDVWWHLAAGRWIVEHGALPASDPFGVWDADSACARSVLQSQWLGQAALFSAHALAGEAGVEALRVLLLVAAATLVYVRTQHAGGSVGAALTAGALAALLLTGYGGERPQLFSFALLGVAWLLVERLCRDDAPHRALAARVPYTALVAFALLLVVWAQLHGGVLLAALSLAAFATGGALTGLLGDRAAQRTAAETIATPGVTGIAAAAPAAGDAAAATAMPSPGGATTDATRATGDPVPEASPPAAASAFTASRLAFFTLLAGVPLLATLANPAGVDSWVCVATLEQGELRERVSEYQRPHVLLTAVPNLWVWAACLALLPFGLWRWWARRDFARLAAASLLAGFGVLAYRYVPFFVLAVLPWLLAELSAAAAPRGGRRGEAALVALALSLAVVVVLRSGPQRSTADGAARFPVAAVALLQTAGVEGRLFTTLGWGGYALWHLHPCITPNIDGRYLDHRAVAVYTHILWQTPFGAAAWAGGRHDLALLPWRSGSGQPYPLAQLLLRDPNWRVAAQTPHYLLAVRRGSPADRRLSAAGPFLGAAMRSAAGLASAGTPAATVHSAAPCAATMQPTALRASMVEPSALRAAGDGAAAGTARWPAEC